MDVFPERVIETAELVVVNQDINNSIIQHQLNDVLTDGLKEDVIVRKIIWGRPNTFKDAMEIATNEMSCDRTFRLLCREEAMDVDMIAKLSQGVTNKKVDCLTEQMSGVRNQ